MLFVCLIIGLMATGKLRQVDYVFTLEWKSVRLSPVHHIHIVMGAEWAIYFLFWPDSLPSSVTAGRQPHPQLSLVISQPRLGILQWTLLRDCGTMQSHKALASHPPKQP